MSLLDDKESSYNVPFISPVSMLVVVIFLSMFIVLSFCICAKKKISYRRNESPSSASSSVSEKGWIPIELLEDELFSVKDIDNNESLSSCPSVVFQTPPKDFDSSVITSRPLFHNYRTQSSNLSLPGSLELLASSKTDFDRHPIIILNNSLASSNGDSAKSSVYYSNRTFDVQ